MALELRPVQSDLDLEAIVPTRAVSEPEEAGTVADLRASRGFHVDLHDMIASDGSEAVGFGYAAMFPAGGPMNGRSATWS